MPRVNIDDALWMDPRMKYLAQISGLDEFGVVGRLAMLWRWIIAHQDELQNLVVTASKIDLVTRTEGFAEFLLRSEMAREQDSGVYVCGTRKYGEWYAEILRRAKIGGKKSVISRQKKSQPRAQAKGQAHGQPAGQAHASPHGQPGAQPSGQPSLLLDLTAKPDPEKSNNPEGSLRSPEPSPQAAPVLSFYPSEPLGFSFSGSGSTEPIGEILLSEAAPDDWAEGTSPQQTIKLVADEERRKPSGAKLRAALDASGNAEAKRAARAEKKSSDLTQVIAEWDRLYAESSGGEKPTWNGATIAPLQTLLRSHSADTVLKRMIMLYKRPPGWLRSDHSLPSTRTFLGLFDRLIDRIDVLPAENGKNYNPTKFFRDRAIAQEEKDRKAIAAGGEAERVLSIFDILPPLKIAE